MNTYLYCRVSHSSSAESGISIESQVEQGLDYIAKIIPDYSLAPNSYGSDIPGVMIDDGVSAWQRSFARRRAGGCIAANIQPGDHIVCYAIDRLCRNLRDFVNTTHHWSEMGVNVHYIADQINTSTAIGRLQAHIKAAQAQFVSDLISERTREALLIKKLGLAEGCPTKSKDTAKWATSHYTIQSREVQARPVGRIFRYERVSTNHQYISGLGLEHQSAANLAAAQKLSAELGGEIYPSAFVDPAVSAFSTKFADRPAGKLLLESVMPGDDIIIYRHDRAWRNPGDAVEMCDRLREKGVFVHLVNEGIRTDTRQGMEWIGVLSSLSHLESVMRSKRVREAHAKCAAEGRPIGKNNRGFKVHRISSNRKKLVLDTKESVRLAAVWYLHEERGLSHPQISDIMNAWDCKEKGVRYTLAYKQHRNVSRLIRRVIPTLQKRVGPMMWEKLLDDGKALANQPIERKYWVCPTWEWIHDAA